MNKINLVLLVVGPKYSNTKLGEIVRAITIDSKHTWRNIQKATGFTEKELNFHLAQLFNEGAIKKEKGKYFVIPSLEAEWLAYHKQSDTITSSVTSTMPTDKESMRITQSGFIVLNKIN